MTTHTGEQRLMQAVLEDAIDCYRNGAGTRDARRRRRFEEAERWIMGPSAGETLPFDVVCRALGLSPDTLRVGLRTRRPRVESVDRSQTILRSAA